MGFRIVLKKLASVASPEGHNVRENGLGLFSLFLKIDMKRCKGRMTAFGVYISVLMHHLRDNYL
jgi:hypothetical protein